MTATMPDLRGADVILVAHSGGKDSMAMLDRVQELARPAGVLDRVVVLHNPLGLVEWPGTAALVAEHAAHYGLRHEERWREHGDLLQQIRERRMWPGNGALYCRSDQKRSPSWRLITELVAELGIPRSGPLARQAQVLYCLGLRAQESPFRSRLQAVMPNAAASSGVRAVTTWHPIIDWLVESVWKRVRSTGLRWHEAYDPGMDMTRLSCSLCVVASRADLVRAARLRPDLADIYVDLEWEIGDSFRPDVSMLEIRAEAQAQRVDEHRLHLLRLRAEHNRGRRRLARLDAQSPSALRLGERLAAVDVELRRLGSAPDQEPPAASGGIAA